MKKSLSLCIFVALAFASMAQQPAQWRWANQHESICNYTSYGLNIITHLSHDVAGSTYLVGTFFCYSTIDGQPILADSVAFVSNNIGMLLAKRDTNGNRLWHRAVKSSHAYTDSSPIALEVNDSNIIVCGKTQLFDSLGTGREWLYFFDTMITSQQVLSMPVADRRPPFDFGEWTYVATLDLDGNLLSATFLSVEEPQNHYRRPLSYCWQYYRHTASNTSNGAFHRDASGNNVFVMAQRNLGRDDEPTTLFVSQYSPFGGFAADTFDISIPLGVCANNYLFYKFSPMWDSLTYKPLVQSMDSFVPDPAYYRDVTNAPFGCMTNAMDVDEEGNYYIAGAADIGYGTHSYPFHLYFSSNVSMTVNADEEDFPPFVLKLDVDGNVLWCSQLHFASRYQSTRVVSFTGVDVSGGEVYVPIYSKADSLSVDGVGNFANNMAKCGWMSCDKSTGEWQQVIFSNSMKSMAEARNTNFVHENFLFITGLSRGEDNVSSDIIEYWLSDGTPVDTLHIGTHQGDAWASVDGSGNLRLRKSSQLPFNLGSYHLQCAGNSIMAVCALYHNDAFAEYYHRNGQSILWNQNLSYTLADSAVTLYATSTSGYPVTFSSSDTSIARCEGSTLLLLAEGSCTITAHCAGDILYSPATPISKTLTINHVGIDDSPSSTALRIYPNPTKEQVNLYGLADDVTAVEVYDMAGRLVGRHGCVVPEGGRYCFSVANLPAGSYIVKVVSAGKHGKSLRMVIKN